VFKWGQASSRLSVGSRGDWSVSGPGVVPIHLWLNFDGKQLFAASADAGAYLQGRQLGNDWNPVRDGEELRFGFALLRVAREDPRSAISAKARSRRRLTWPVALGMLLASMLALAGIITGLRGSTRQANDAAPATSAASTSTPATPAVPPPAAEPARAVPAPTFAEQLVEPPATPPSQLVDPLGSPTRVAEGAETPPATLKPPAAFPQNIANRPVPRIGDKPWLISEEWQQHHERLLHASNRASARVIFLGDSITEAWGVAPAFREYFSKYSPLNLGLAGDTTQNVLWRIEHGALDGTHPQVVVLLIGINNLAGGFSPEQTSDGVRAIVAAVQTHLPAACVLLLAILPARQEPANPLRQRIQDANRLLANIAKPGRVELHDLGSVLLEPDGTISKSTTRDFVHPTPEGFERLSRAMAPLLDSLMAHTVE
jgi:lysophospholipase L1-like esterase